MNPSSNVIKLSSEENHLRGSKAQSSRFFCGSEHYENNASVKQCTSISYRKPSAIIDGFLFGIL